jgi:hypothetical protein
MSDNIQIYDATSTLLDLRTTDTAGVHVPHHIIDSLPAISLNNTPADIAAGLVAGRKLVNVYGRNFDIDTGSVPEDLWNGGGLYTGFPVTGSAETLSIVSSSTDDDSAGTGARTLKIHGLNSDYEEINETVTLDGTTPVTTVATFWRVFYAEVLTAGSGGFNAGTITANHSTTTANVFFVMPVGRNRSNIAVYTIPAGYTGVLESLGVWIRSAVTALSADGELMIRPYGQAAQMRHPWACNNTTPFGVRPAGGLVLSEKSDITIRVSATSANNMDIVGAFDIELIAT